MVDDGLSSLEVFVVLVADIEPLDSIDEVILGFKKHVFEDRRYIHAEVSKNHKLDAEANLLLECDLRLFLYV